MKKNYKKIIGILSVATILVVGIMATYAYLTGRTETLTNTFTVGKVAIELEEPLWNATDADHKIIPGAQLAKDPTLSVLQNSEEAYVFLYVEYSKEFEDYKELFDIDFNDAWNLLSEESGSYVYAYNETVSPSSDKQTLPSLFTNINFSTELEGDDLTTLSTGNIKITGYAIQASGIANVNDAWSQLMESNTN